MRFPTAMMFPVTVPRAEFCLPLLLLCDRIAWCRTVETASNGPDAAQGDHFTKLPFCQARTPAPLGAARESFAALLQDLRTGRGDARGRFVRLALAAMGENAAGERESMAEIRGSLRGERALGPLADEAQGADAAALWQARLILELGALLDAEEEQLRSAMTEIQLRERALFAALRGEETAAAAGVPDPLPAAAASGPVNDRMLRLRLRAWTRLYLAGPREERQGDLPVTDRLAAWERLCECGRLLSSAEPVVLAELPLPAADPAGVARDFLARAVAFRQEQAGALASLERALRPGGPTLPLEAAVLQSWIEGLRRHFPDSRLGWRLTLARFPSVDAAGLLKEAFAGEGAGTTPSVSAQTGSACLGLLQPAAS